MEISEWIDLYMGAVLVILVWRELLKEQNEKLLDMKTTLKDVQNE